MEKRDGFLFYRSYFEAISQLEPGDQLKAYQAVCDYGLNGAAHELSGASAAVFMLARPNLDASRKKASAGSTGGKTKANGKQSGSEPEADGKQSGSKHEADGKQSGSKPEAVCKQTASRPQAIKDKGQEIKDEGRETREDTGARAGKPRAIPPTLEEVTAYVAERGSPVDPQRFIDFYASKGWMVGKTPMKDWKAACRNAENWDCWKRQTTASERPSTQRESFAEIAARMEREGRT